MATLIYNPSNILKGRKAKQLIDLLVFRCDRVVS